MDKMIESLVKNGKTYKVCNGVHYNEMTLDTVIHVLEKARENNDRVRVFYGDTLTGRDWCETNDIMGYVSRSYTGGGDNTTPIPILLRTKMSRGGGAILTNNIVRITIDKHDVYKHPNYHVDLQQFNNTLKRAGETFSVHHSAKEAHRALMFYLGESNRPY